MCIKRAIARVLLPLILAGMMFGTLTGCGTSSFQPPAIPEKYQTADSEFDAKIKGQFGFTQVAKSQNLSLWIDGQTAEVMIQDEASGKKWYSNPKERFDDPDFVGNAASVYSQVWVQYNLNDSPTTVNSYSDAVNNSQYSFSEISGGIRVNFVMGDKPRLYLVPQVLSVERFQQISSKLTSDEQEQLTKYYMYISLDDPGLDEQSKRLILQKFPVLGKGPAYITQMRTSITDPDFAGGRPMANKMLLEKLEKLLAQAGYTEKDYLQDNTENGVTVPMLRDYSIALSVEYTLDDGAFVATIPQDSIVYDDSLFKVTQITLLPAFGAANDQQSGYIFVPDGCGSLIYLNNKKDNLPSYSQRVYGSDYTLPGSVSSESNISSAQLFMPVFGMKTGDAAFFAVIEDGDGIAQINAETSSDSLSCNIVNTTFLVNSSQRPYTRSLNAKYSLFYQKELAKCNLSVRYGFLYGDEAGYSGMAHYYQQYLLGRGMIQRQQIVEDIPLYITTLQAVNYYKSIAGVPVISPLSLTSFDQTKQIVEEMKSKGVRSFILELDGWSNGGINHTVMNKVEFISELGGRKRFLSLLQYTRENQIPLYPSCDFQYVPKHTSFSGYDQNKNSARTLENVISTNATNGVGVQSSNSKDWSVISPLYYETVIGSFLNSYRKYDADGIAMKWMGYDLVGDYRSNNMTDRQASRNIIAEQIKQIANEGYRVNIKGANIFALSGASFLSGLTVYNGGINITDESVPFYQIVMHGILPYSGEPLNMSADYVEDALKMIETGSAPAFMWMYEDNAILKDTDYTNYNSLCYKPWAEQAAEVYSKVNVALHGCAGATITSHQKIKDKVYKTVYSNGVSIYVNYNDKPQTVDGVMVAAMDFARMG